MNNQRGGIISKLLFIPLGVVLVLGFFFLGYLVGKYRSKAGEGPAAAAPPLPEIISKDVPTTGEFTFYKTLTDKSDKTVSIDLHASYRDDAKDTKKTPAAAVPSPEKDAQHAKAVKPAESMPASKQQPTVKKEVASAAKNTKLRYTLQVASYQEKEMAESDIRRMKQHGYAAFMVASDLPGKGTWYRVRLGSFSTKMSAEKLQRELRSKESIASIITVE